MRSIYGDAACYSFYATKNITSGEGGAISTNDVAKADLLKMLRSHGIDRTAGDRYTKKYQHWDMTELGWKYNMDNIQAALLIGQLERIETLWQRRNAIAMQYEEAFDGVKGIELMKTAPNSKHPRHLFTIQVSPERRDEILYKLQGKGIGVAVNYRAIHLLKYYREHFGFKEGDFPVAEKIGYRTISIPLYPKMSRNDVELIVSSVMQFVGSSEGAAK